MAFFQNINLSYKNGRENFPKVSNPSPFQTIDYAQFSTARAISVKINYLHHHISALYYPNWAPESMRLFLRTLNNIRSKLKGFLKKRGLFQGKMEKTTAEKKDSLQNLESKSKLEQNLPPNYQDLSKKGKNPAKPAQIPPYSQPIPPFLKVCSNPRTSLSPSKNSHQFQPKKPFKSQQKHQIHPQNTTK